MTPGITPHLARKYFEEDSMRNTYRDEEFFRVFEQYLEEAIVQLIKHRETTS